MGLIDNVNVQVNGSGDIVSTLQSYITKILKPNIVDGRNVLEQWMVSVENTKYVIKYDFTLNGGTIEMPENCIIEIDGGSINNGTLVGDDTKLLNVNDDGNALEDTTLDGTWEEIGGIDKSRVAFLADEDGEAVIPDFDPVTDTVWNKEQVLTPAQKDNVLENVVNKTSTNGMAHVVLRADKTFEEQVTQENTVYHIRYDYILGANVTIPANCVLEFEGGSIGGNKTLTGQNTGIQAGLVKIFNTDVTLAGTWNVAEAYPEWFGAKGDGVRDESLFIQKALNVFDYICFNKHYLVNTEIDFTNLENKTLFGKSRSLISSTAHNTIFYGFRSNSITFDSLNFDGNWDGIYEGVWIHEMNAAIIFGHYCNNTIIRNCSFKNLFYGVCTGTEGQGKNAYIINNRFENLGSDIDTLGWPGIVISNNISNNCKGNSIQIEPNDTNTEDIEDFNNAFPTSDTPGLCVNITNNVITNCTGIAIDIHTSSYNVIISNNNIYNYGINGIYVHGKTYGVLISNNIIKNCISAPSSIAGYSNANCAISVRSSSNIKCTDNLIVYPNVGIQINGSDAENVEVKNNTVLKARMDGITIYRTKVVFNGNIIKGYATMTSPYWAVAGIYLYNSETIIDNCYIDATEDCNRNTRAVFIEGGNILKLNDCYCDNVVYEYSSTAGDGIGGRIYNKKGAPTTFNETPSNMSQNDKGLYGFITGNGYNRPTWYNGSDWVEYDRAVLGVRRAGTFEQAPTSGIFQGFAYFASDKGVANKGAVIFYTGSSITPWVYSDGSAVV